MGAVGEGAVGQVRGARAAGATSGGHGGVVCGEAVGAGVAGTKRAAAAATATRASRASRAGRVRQEAESNSGGQREMGCACAEGKGQSRGGRGESRNGRRGADDGGARFGQKTDVECRRRGRHRGAFWAQTRTLAGSWERRPAWAIRVVEAAWGGGAQEPMGGRARSRAGCRQRGAHLTGTRQRWRGG